MRVGDAEHFEDGLRVSAFPFVAVRIDCALCPRKGSYRLARIVARYGPETPMRDVLDALAKDCMWRRSPGSRPAGKYDPRCGARLTDIDRYPPPLRDLPPAMGGPRLATDKGKRVA